MKDFTPYATKIRSSEADAIITGNWGADMVGLGKAVIEAGVAAPIYTYYAAADGITATFGEKGDGVIRQIHEGKMNPPTEEFQAHVDAFKKSYPNHDFNQSRILNVVQMLAKAIEAAGGTDPVKLGLALEGMEHVSIQGSKLYMRPQDHQLIQDLHISVHTKDGIVVDYDNSGYGMKVESTVEMAGEKSETTCKMDRPEA